MLLPPQLAPLASAFLVLAACLEHGCPAFWGVMRQVIYHAVPAHGHRADPASTLYLEVLMIWCFFQPLVSSLVQGQHHAVASELSDRRMNGTAIGQLQYHIITYGWTTALSSG